MPLRFPRSLQQSRLKCGLKQATLAERLGVRLRTYVSWETGERLPSVGVVARLNALLDADLLTPYVIDDLVRHYGPEAADIIAIQGAPRQRKGGDEQPANALLGLREARAEWSATDRVRDATFTHNQRAGSPEGASPDQREGHDEVAPQTLEQFFTILEYLRAQPYLIAITLDFLREIAGDAGPTAGN